MPVWRQSLGTLAEGKHRIKLYPTLKSGYHILNITAGKQVLRKIIVKKMRLAMKRFLLFAAFLLSLQQIVIDNSYTSVFAQKFAYENDSYWLPDIGVTGKNIQKFVSIMNSYADPSVFSHHIGGYDWRCTFDKTIFFIILALLFSANRPIMASTPDTLYFHYYASGMDGVKKIDMEDKIIVIVKDKHRYKCFFYGTSDDFEEAREGYLPGFISIEATNLSFSGGEISFHLNSTNHNFYSQPVEIGLHTDENIIAAGYRLWLQPSENCWCDVTLRGTYTQDSIVIYNETFPYINDSIVFYKEPMERIKSYNRNLISPDLERENNINFDGYNSIFGDPLP